MSTSKLNHHILILLIVGIVVYCNVLFNQFVWDDAFQPIGNKTASVSQNLTQIFFVKIQDFHYRPVFFSYLYLLNVFAGPTPFVFHLLQISLHLANGILLFLLCTKLLGKTPAFFIAIVFLIHPINQEAVGFISATADVLFFFFGILALYLSFQPRLATWKIGSIGILIFLSLLTKENGVIFIPLILFLRYLSFKSTEIGVWVSLLLALLGYLFLRLVIVGTWVTHSIFSPMMKLPLRERLVNIPAIFLYYLKTFFFPARLAISQQWTVTTISIINFYVPLVIEIIGVSVLILAIVFLFRKSKEKAGLLIFFSLWFFMGIGVHLQIVPLDMTVADRWFYLPIAGLLGIVATLASSIHFSTRTRQLGTIILVMILTLFGARTVARNFNWRDGETLFTHDIPFSPESYDIENNYGRVLLNAKRLDEAEIHFRKSISLEAKSPVNWYNLGIVYVLKKDKIQARDAFRQAIKNDEYFFQAYEYLAVLLLKEYSASEAETFLEEAVVKFPADATLWKDLSATEVQLKKFDDSITAAQKAYDLLPNQENFDLLSRLKTIP